MPKGITSFQFISNKRKQLQRVERDVNSLLHFFSFHRDTCGTSRETVQNAESDLTWAAICIRRALRAMGGRPSEE